MPIIKVPPVLRPQTEGEAEVTVEGGTVGDALRALAERYPSASDQLFSPEGELNRYVNVYLNDEDVRVLDGLDTDASDSDTVVILPAMAGGEPAGS
jgi:molybdopterin synthase sulfur carrier subunit